MPALKRFLAKLGPCCALALAIMLVAAPCPAAQPDRPAPLVPRAGAKFRVAYIETGEYWSYTEMFESIRAGLRQRHWSDRVEFPPELRLSLGWGEENRKRYRERVAQLLNRDDVDMVLSLGTEATLAVIAENKKSIPVVATSISNPLASGIVTSATSSGRSYLTTFLNPSAGRQMFQLFHGLTGFKKIGIMYNNTVVGKSYSFSNDAIEAGRDLGFAVAEYSGLSANETVDDCLTGIKALHEQGADAIFISDLNCVDLSASDPTPLYDYLDANHILTFSSADREQVRNFAMMGVLHFDTEQVGDFQAGQIINIFSGYAPGELSMLAPYSYRLLINIDVAERNNITLPVETLIIADEIFLKQLRLKGNAPQ